MAESCLDLVRLWMRRLLIAPPFGVRGVEGLFGVSRLFPSVGVAEQELGEISCWYVFASRDSASTKLLADANEQAQ